ncbi:MAG TPA: XRE family transcriptional regulator [Steroidobacteraceae bacterium]|jgi:predicted XRE-type DNA-binding protein|nr:XRE family transcriptional regulator [Steroidobacteraceae bacterium]
MPAKDDATIEALRNDLALQIARFARRLGATQVVAARRLGVPQPTLSKILHGRVSNLSVELLIRIAVRAGLPLTLQTGVAPEEAGVFLSFTSSRRDSVESRSKLGEEARESLARSDSLLTGSQRLEAFLEHNQQIAALRAASSAAGGRPARRSGSRP